MIIKLITTVTALFLAITAFAQPFDTNKIDSFINHLAQNNQSIGSVSVFQDGKEIYNKSFGQSKLAHTQYNPETKYQIGSITKMITATLIFDLIENNTLNLSDTLSSFFPEIPNAPKITIKNLLEHSSGLGDFTAKNDSLTWLTKKVSEQDIFDEIIKQGVSFQPNEKVRYSNSGYFLLTKILEKQHNKKYATIVEEKIIQPLSLQNFTSITEDTKNIYPSYKYTNEWKESVEFDFSNVIGVGDIVSTTQDLNTFLFNLMQAKILSKESVDQMKPIYTQKESFGRGLMFIPFYDHVFYGHGGDTYGTHSIVSYNEQDGLGLAFSINGERFPHNDFAIGILSIIYGKEYDFPEFDTLALNPEDLDQFLGVYSSPTFPIKLTISKEGNLLKGQGTGQPEFPLECYEPNKFKLDQINLKIEFFPEENKLIFNQNGHIFELTKE